MDINKICRTCLLQNDPMKSIFNREVPEEDINIYDMLCDIVSIKIQHDDGFPDQICSQCLNYVVQSYSFKKLCEKSDETLRQLINKELRKALTEFKPKSSDILLENNPSLLLTADGKFSMNETNSEYCNIELDCNDAADKSLLSLDVKYLENITGNESSGKNKISNVEQNINELSNSSEDNLVKSYLEVSNDLPSPDYNKEVPEVTDNEDNIATEEIDSLEDASEIFSNINLDSLKIEINPPNTEAKATEISEETVTGESILPCHKCTSVFVSESDLEKHLKQVHKKIVCKICDKNFSSVSTLCRHMKVHDTARRHLCNECGKGFSRSDDLTRHLRTHTGERPFICKLCSKAFAQSFRLLEHMRAHANEKTFQCSDCGKAFSRHTSLSNHKKTHLGIKNHVCDICGKKLCGSNSLQMHMKIHTGKKDNICPYCDKGFTTPSNLKIHQRIHTGEKPYVCSVCSKGFPDPSRLTVHLRSHSGEKPYVCNVCQRGCISSSQLKKHMRIHTGEKPYKCHLCPKVFSRSEDLKIHIKIHTGDSHLCTICNKEFYQSSTLKVHMRIHTGEKPYACNVCNKTFSQTGSLTTHIRSHLKE